MHQNQICSFALNNPVGVPANNRGNFLQGDEREPQVLFTKSLCHGQRRRRLP
jgi:hypothetical protein